MSLLDVLFDFLLLEHLAKAPDTEHTELPGKGRHHILGSGVRAHIQFSLAVKIRHLIVTQPVVGKERAYQREQ